MKFVLFILLITVVSISKTLLLKLNKDINDILKTKTKTQTIDISKLFFIQEKNKLASSLKNKKLDFIRDKSFELKDIVDNLDLMRNDINKIKETLMRNI